MDGASFFSSVGRRTVEQLAAAVKITISSRRGIADGGDKTFNERADHFRFVIRQSPFPKVSGESSSKIFINYTMEPGKKQIQMAKMAQVDIK